MERFEQRVLELRESRLKLLEESRKKRRSGGGKRKKKKQKMKFDSPELTRIFNSMPAELQEMMRKGRAKE